MYEFAADNIINIKDKISILKIFDIGSISTVVILRRYSQYFDTIQVSRLGVSRCRRGNIIVNRDEILLGEILGGQTRTEAPRTNWNSLH